MKKLLILLFIVPFIVVKAEYNNFNDYTIEQLKMYDNSKDVHYLYQSYYFINNTGLDLKCKVLNKFGDYYMSVKNKFAAANCFSKIINVSEYNGDKVFKKITADSYTKLSLTSTKYDTTSNTLQYLKKAEQLYLDLNDIEGLCNVYNHLGNYYFNYKSLYNKNDKTYIECLNYYNLSLNLAYGLNKNNYISRGLNNIGCVYLEQNINGKALDYFNSALKIRTIEKDSCKISSTLTNIGIVYKNLSELEKAIIYFKTALEYCLDDDKKLTNLLMLSKTYEKKYDFKSAYSYQNKYVEEHKRKYNTVNENHLKYLYAKFEYDNKLKQIRILQQENTIKDLSIRNSKIIYSLFFLLIFVLLFICLYTYQLIVNHYKKIKINLLKQVKKELDYTNTNLTAILESSDMCMILLDTNFKIIHYNKQASNIFKYYFKKDIELDVYIQKYLIGTNSDSIFKEISKNILINKIYYMTEYNTSDNKWFKMSFHPIILNGKLVSINLTVDDITEIKVNEMCLKTSIKEKTSLIKEIHHRVKNNIQTIISLLNLQKSQFCENDVEKLNTLQDRIFTISNIHEILYTSNNLSIINIIDVLNKMFDKKYKLNQNENKFKYDIKIENLIEFDIEIAVPLSMIFNELINNSLMHNFNSDLFLSIEIMVDDTNNSHIIKYSDNGKGLNNKEFKLGLELTDLLITNNLRGDYKIYDERGFNILIEIPFYKK